MNNNFLKEIEPGSIIGILGGGQLGRMTVEAASKLGYQCHVFCQSEEEPAAQISRKVTVASFEDQKSLESFASSIDIVTLEFENIPLDSVKFIESFVPVRPNSKIQSIVQNRINEKKFISNLNIKTAPFIEVPEKSFLFEAAAQIGAPAVLKTASMGYDGKGQVLINKNTDLELAWEESGASPKTNGAILEGFISFKKEISVIAGRSTDGSVTSYVPVENFHVDHILDQTLAPANITHKQSIQAIEIAHQLIIELDVVGLLAVEMFINTGGDILVNEVAARPHNSGHWTIEACNISQFELLVRAICGLPLGSTERNSDARMKNLLGEEINRYHDFLTDPSAHVHFYGKSEAKSGRKMGHVNWLSPKSIK